MNSLAPDTAALHALLDQGLAAHAPEYDQGLSNHLPMLLHALQQLGAPPQRLAACAQAYASRLEPLAAPGAQARPDLQDAAAWLALRGDLAAYGPLRRHFAERLADEGRDATLRQLLPTLMPGVAAGAFHGLIRTAHGLEAGHDGELAAGLAYWAAAWLPLRTPAAPWPQPRWTPAGWLDALQALPAIGPLPQPRITLRMQAVAAAPGFEAVATALQVDDSTLRALAERAAALYAATGNFTVLHAVTASRAMAVLLPQLGEAGARNQALREFALALGAALHASRLTHFDPAANGSAPAARSWPALTAAAIAASDDHTAKLVHACLQFERQWPGPGPGRDEAQAAPWAQAATRATLA